VLDDAGTLTISGTGPMDDWPAAGEGIPWYVYRKSVTSIVMEKGITNIEYSSFDKFTNLESVYIPNSVTSINRSAFRGCSNLKTIIIPESVTTIGSSAFNSCVNLKSVYFLGSLTNIGSYAFGNCSNLMDVHYSGTQEQWFAISIGDGNDTLNRSNFHSSLKSGACGDNLTWVLNDVGSLIIAGIGDMELRAFHRGSGNAIFLVDCQLRHLMVYEDELLLITCIQANGLDTIVIVIGQIIRCRDGLLGNFIATGQDTLGDGTIFLSGPIFLIVIVNALDREYSARDNSVFATSLDLLNGHERLLQILKNQLIFTARCQEDRLSGFFSNDVGLGNGLFSHFIAVNRDTSQNCNALTGGGDILMISKVNALDFKRGVSHRLSSLLILL
jgi:hypothetical protein